MDLKEMKSLIEALLFTWGDPLNIREIENITGVSQPVLKKLLAEMTAEFNQDRRGIQLIRSNNNYQLGTRPEHHEYIRQLHSKKENKAISNAAMETLTIIAYKQPLTKIEMEEIRGVKCDKAIQTLVDKNLIREVGRLEKPGKPILYGTTEDFLRAFGLASLKELPALEIEENLHQIEIGEGEIR